MQETLNNLTQKLTPWLSEHGWKVLAIVVGAYLITKFSRLVIGRIVRSAVTSNKYSTKEGEEKRENTLIVVFDGSIKVAVWLATIVIVLSEIGINISPLLAGAGIIGLAFGFGGQYLIKDIITGFFIILENQYRVGDIVEIDGTKGKVENINLRTTIIRDDDGAVHTIPNGSIKKTANKSRTFSKVNLKIGVSYDADIDKVERVVNRIGEEILKDKEWGEKITSQPVFIRVNEFADSSVIIKISCDTKPQKQWEVAGELRRRIKKTFNKEGIEIPYPQVVIHQKK